MLCAASGVAVILLASFGEIRYGSKDVDQPRKLAKWVRFAKMCFGFFRCATPFPKKALRHDPENALGHKWVRFAKIFEGGYRVEIPLR
jgi:hypothetical protein